MLKALLIGTLVYLLVQLNVWYRARREEMSPEERKAEDDELGVW